MPKPQPIMKCGKGIEVQYYRFLTSELEECKSNWSASSQSYRLDYRGERPRKWRKEELQQSCSEYPKPWLATLLTDVVPYMRSH
jgi:hypothetical protein